ncbi:hypothetical protein [Corynebacterium epidermidicanis]|uniref:Uncharacterized protein n=1 Tax=Corynebacterium epidermidicanis TaxID=1050174 RepID=A0A0G3GUJ1_9CORY|nr:hypothetical protein [Corynebacterium epidermidicanis]AKK03188.1 hypothetical protein CEPID_06650 [Corynebacterium epidermidicanis]
MVQVQLPLRMPTLLHAVTFCSVFIEYKLTSDGESNHLTVKDSSFEVRVHTQPAIRFEYERLQRKAPAAHVYFTEIGGLLSPALMNNAATKKGWGKISEHRGKSCSIFNFDLQCGTIRAQLPKR